MRVKAVLLGLLLMLALVPVPVAHAASTASPDAVFEEVWETVRDRFYDPALHGLDWDAVGRRYRPLAAAAKDDAARAAVINAMLAEPHASHTGYYTRADTAYYDLADIFSGGLRRQLADLFPNGEVAYTGIGIFTRQIDGKTFVSGVLDGEPAAQAGLRVGDEILAADGGAFGAVTSFDGKAAQRVTLTIRRTRDGVPTQIAVVPHRIRPNETFLDAMRASIRTVERGGRRIGYVHVWSYARDAYQALLEREISMGRFKDADAIVWDLRDGWGGASPSYLDIFDPRGPTMTMTNRSGDKDVDNARWRKPVALLINGGTRSGKEVLAYGFKKYGYGPVIGTRSEGALLAARAFLMDDGSLLLLPVTDVAVDGERLEGRGVDPTIEVPFDLPYAAGADPQLERAVDELARTAGG
ncbi:MAG TPA: S41 family peptidase [Methylomirabilota bacterium]|nr:S41 family peptidase [Methylomirabilota bacterium]